MAEVNLKNLTKKYGDVVAVQDMNLKIPHNEFLVLVSRRSKARARTRMHTPRLLLANAFTRAHKWSPATSDTE